MSVRVFVPDIPELRAIVDAGRAMPACTVRGPVKGFWSLESAGELVFERKPMKFGPALWNALLCGGYCGHIREFGRDRLVIGPDAS
jgi:hypothetical protein